MNRIRLGLLVMALGALVVGCQDGPGLMDNGGVRLAAGVKDGALRFATADDIESATFNIYVGAPSDQTVNVHRITADWGEMTVTWNNFGGAFDANVEGSFNGGSSGWHTVDVTDLVKSWMDGTYDNYGLLLDQAVKNYPRVMYSAREGDYPPYLEICYEGTGGRDCVQQVAVADAYIWESGYDFNYGSEGALFTGWYDENSLEKQALVRFELPEPPELAAIGDYVWHDQNQDGIQDAGEPGIEGVTVNLYVCEGRLLESMMTDADGLYMFDGLEAGDYNVEFVLLAGYEFSPQNQGMDPALDSDADPMTGEAACTTLDEGEIDSTWDAGMYMPPQEGCTRTIGYWKNWTGLGPQPDMVSDLLPVTLGTGSGKSRDVLDVYDAVDYLSKKVYGAPSNGITKLYAQLLAAKLSINNGASGDDVADAIEDADEFLGLYDYEDWGSLTDEQRDSVMYWHGMFDDYNNGVIGPGHCHDELPDNDPPPAPGSSVGSNIR